MPTVDTDPIDIRRKRLLYRSWHRGMKEMDLILGSFAEQNLASFDAHQLELYEHILNHPDPDLLAWFMGRQAAPNGLDRVLLKLIKNVKLRQNDIDK
ncbi:MAG: succinate dehydrogenase assembly factor 2 [Alphaproteobacteria bacterium]|nr:succinate dehydrogenase assembly factor 2 [Alphaproteobacteria bacterium]